MTSELALAQCPRALLSQKEHSPVLFTQLDQRPSVAASDMISFGVSDNKLDDSFTLPALDSEELLGSVDDPALLPSSASRSARLKADDELIPLCQRLSTSSGSNGLHLRNRLAAGWTSGFYRGAIRLSANVRPASWTESHSAFHFFSPRRAARKPCSAPSGP